MFKITKFVVVPYGRDGAREEAEQFYTREEAEGVRDRKLRRRERVDLYEVTGWPVQDLWDRPRKLAD